MPVLLNITQRIFEWGTNPGYMHPAPDEVKSTFRFLVTLRHLSLIRSKTFLDSTKRNKVARLVIDKLLEEP